ncbi:MAG TPA: hypothetical protein ENH45_06655 [Nitrospirae bacterium]|nr:hypothetical protein BMS3Abin09_00101 [bacterium BMS3Abin09]GBE40378.1 hypothetical protein BMS3Bbin09_00258 [bacterium BMS3Bbin09]HDH34954.1 hypothetical protein [Nitrospirota bacterium]HDO66636.1 hypothetical protein [Nitrospirota bacterium]HDZ84885.1 hypothetical protein [Nitrospirota bacterium]
MRLLQLLISCLFVTCLITGAYGKDITPPKCLGGVCLLQTIDEIDNKVYGYGKQVFGTIAFLKDNGRFATTGAQKIETLNWVSLTSCESEKVVKSIHRVIKDEQGKEFDSLFSEYELKYGVGEDLGYLPSDQKSAQWRWKNPGTDLTLIWNGRLNIVSIDLNSYDSIANDIKCQKQANLNDK